MREYDEGYRLGYVVVTWNQASGQPDISYRDIHHRRVDAGRERDHLREETTKAGRRERHTIAVLIEPEDDEEEATDG